MMKKLISFIIRKTPRRYLQLFSHLFLRLLIPFYRGDALECPVCKTTFRKFLPYGRQNPRENALCPGCLALERHRLLWLYLQDRTEFFTARLDTLHIAPEICFIKRFRRQKNLKYVTADLESPLADIKMDIHKMPFPDNEFDVVFCNHVMEHVEDDLKAMREIYRVLRPGGWAIIQSPQDYSLLKTYEDPSIISPADREKAYGQSDHLRTYGRDYDRRLSAAGFDVLADEYVKELPEEKRLRHALPAEETIYLCRKNAQDPA